MKAAILGLILFLLTPAAVHAQEWKSAAINTAAHAVMKVVTQWAEGDLDGHILRAAGTGGAGGAAFYVSKRLVGNGRYFAGWGAEVVGLSLVASERPLTRIYIPTPIGRISVGRGGDFGYVFDVTSVYSLAGMIYEGRSMRMAGPYLYFRGDIDLYGALGVMRLGVPLVESDSAIPHELVHAIQYTQIGSMSPHYSFDSLHIAVPWLYGLRRFTARLPYKSQPMEAEAFLLTN